MATRTITVCDLCEAERPGRRFQVFGEGDTRDYAIELWVCTSCQRKSLTDIIAVVQPQVDERAERSRRDWQYHQDHGD